MGKNVYFLYESRFTTAELDQLEKRSGLRMSHLRLFLELILSEAADHDHIVLQGRAGQTFGVVDGP